MKLTLKERLKKWYHNNGKPPTRQQYKSYIVGYIGLLALNFYLIIFKTKTPYVLFTSILLFSILTIFIYGYFKTPAEIKGVY